jgi:hypothetical protein
MKKYVLTETQIKKVVDSIIQEQTDIQTTTATVQCFLNQVMKANLDIDGKGGPNSLTEKALKMFQQKKVRDGHTIIVDGQWGFNTQQTLTPEENKIWANCRSKYERA